MIFPKLSAKAVIRKVILLRIVPSQKISNNLSNL